MSRLLVSPPSLSRSPRPALQTLGPALVGSLFMISPPSDADAGPNAHAVLIAHVNEQLVYTDSESFCDGASLLDCEDADVTVDGEGTAVWFVLGAFPEGSSPRVLGVTFGVSYDPSLVTLVDHGKCGDFELPTVNWPDSGEGIAVTWGSVQSESVLPIYWFAGYSETPTFFQLIPHPVHGADFADDAIPSELDPILALGRLGFGLEGTRPCPSEVHPNPDNCSVVPADAFGGFLIVPEGAAVAYLEGTVTVRDFGNQPIANAFVEITLPPDVLICSTAVLTGFTDSNGEFVYRAAGGGCVANTANAAVIRASGTVIRSFDRVFSPDFDGTSGDGRVGLGDLVEFGEQLFRTSPPVCHDYNDDGVVDVGDLVAFAAAFSVFAQCAP